MTRLHDSIAALVDPGVEPLHRDHGATRRLLKELDAEHLATIAHLRRRHAAARTARSSAGMWRAIDAMTTAGDTYRTRRTTLRAALTGDQAPTTSLLEQLHDAVHGTGGTNGAGGAGPYRAQIGFAAAELLSEIARTIGCREFATHRDMCIRDWAADLDGQDPEVVETWVTAARGILTPPRSLEGTGPCPACGERWIWEREGDENIRRAAIRMVITGRHADDYAECLNRSCATRWPRTHWDLLAAALRTS